MLKYLVFMIPFVVLSAAQYDYTDYDNDNNFTTKNGLLTICWIPSNGSFGCCDGYIPGYHVTSRISCVPACSPACVNAKCERPNVCKCLHGYNQLNSTHCEKAMPLIHLHPITEQHPMDVNHPTTTDSYEPTRKKIWYESSGDSDDEDLQGTGSGSAVPPRCLCENGDCGSGSECESCYRGYELNVITKTCEDVRSSATTSFSNDICNCGNGLCDLNNKCFLCFDGYKLDPVTERCRAKCTTCVNGECVDSFTCECNEGFYLDDQLDFNCTKNNYSIIILVILAGSVLLLMIAGVIIYRQCATVSYILNSDKTKDLAVHYSANNADNSGESVKIQKDVKIDMTTTPDQKEVDVNAVNQNGTENIPKDDNEDNQDNKASTNEETKVEEVITEKEAPKDDVVAKDEEKSTAVSDTS